jgi:hypothetical protein
MEESGLRGVMNSLGESVVEQLWHDLDGQVSRDQIDRTVTEIAAQFQNARVSTFVPIFIHRKALQHLKGILASTSHMAASSAPADDE